MKEEKEEEKEKKETKKFFIDKKGREVPLKDGESLYPLSGM
jgi:hypothetical protein